MTAAGPPFRDHPDVVAHTTVVPEGKRPGSGTTLMSWRTRPWSQKGAGGPSVPVRGLAPAEPIDARRER